jgi:hypothetical protein
VRDAGIVVWLHAPFTWAKAAEAITNSPRHDNGRYLTIIADILDLDSVRALSNGTALMAGNLSDRNPKIYRLELPFFALKQRLGVARLPPHRGLSQ